MVGSIIPIVYGERNARPRIEAHTVYVSGSIAGGATLGLLLGGLGHVLHANRLFENWPTAVLIVAGVVHILGAGRDLGIVRFWLPESRWQVPRQWQYLWPGRWVAAAYGFLLGMNVFTRMLTPALHLVLIWVVLAGDATLGAGVLAVGGAARALPVVFLTARQGAPGLEPTRRLLERLQPAAFIIMGLALAASGGWLLAAGFMRPLG
jgi:hypothetical protein